MVTTIIMRGGLGNQMFEYAFLLALREKGHKVVMDTSYYDYVNMHNGYELGRVFGVKEKSIKKQGLHITWLRFLNRYKPKYLCKFDPLYFDESILNNPRHYMSGYWQDERYFDEIEARVRGAFKFKGMDVKNTKIASDMYECNSVSLHIRRGDYAAFGMSIIGAEYYKCAIEMMKKNIIHPVFYIFSDDVETAKNTAEHLNIDYRLIAHNTGKESYKDMYLMSQCKHNIIANSSFSWWGAWLNTNPEKMIIAPKNWDSNKPNFKPQCKNWILV